MKRKIPEQSRFDIKRPDLLKEWNFEKNRKTKPSNITYGSHKKVWWKCCKCGKEWRMTIVDRCCKNFGCPQCSRKMLRKANFVPVSKTKFAKEWNFTKNKRLNPNTISCRSHKKVWWKCKKCKFEWKAIIVLRDNEQKKCPYCNSLAGLFPILLKEWDYTKNKGINPYKIKKGTHQKLGWICKKNKNHKWDTSPNCRTKNAQNGKITTGCPYCSKTHKKVCTDNCLATKDPELAREWNYNKNDKKLTPSSIVQKSCKSVWWLCKYCGHQWKNTPKARSAGRGCPKCAKILLKDGSVCDSLVEAFFYLRYKKQKLDFKHHGYYCKNLNRKKYDFYFPKINTYIEVTGYNPQCSIYPKYIKKIAAKRYYVNNKLKAKFKFIRYYLSPNEYNYVRKNIKREKISKKG